MAISVVRKPAESSPQPLHGNIESGSFRDPAGFVFRRDGVIYRQVNVAYRDDYDRLIQSGLYQALTDRRLLVPHVETAAFDGLDRSAYRVLRPEPVPFVSYPYEWCFGQLKDAALATLAIQRLALAHGMSLKDSSAFNIQFRGCEPVLIDTLSFERYEAGKPWVAYRQFCQHFLAPLALMSTVDVRLGRLAATHIDGVPLDLASRMLPARTWLSFRLLAHLHLHAAASRRYAGRRVEASDRRMSEASVLGLLDNLQAAVEALRWRPEQTTWADYERETNYSGGARDHKELLVRAFLENVRPRVVWDIGANVGRFSRIAADTGAYALAFDADHSVTEIDYQEGRARGERRVLPLVADLTNPSPSLGWAHSERASWIARGPADAVLALAVVHHLAIGNNVPLPRIAELLQDAGTHLLIEFVPKSDSQVQRLLATRKDVFGGYSQAGFERAFEPYFDVLQTNAVRESERVVYLMRRRSLTL